MDNYTALRRSMMRRLALIMAVTTIALVGLWCAADYAGLNLLTRFAAIGSATVLLVPLMANLATRLSMRPFELLRQAILHVSSDTSHTAAPDIDHIKQGRELMTTLIMDIYNMASQQPKQVANTPPEAAVVGGEAMLNATPLPIFTVTSKDTVQNVNDAGLLFLGLSVTDRPKIVGQNVNDVLNLNFPNEQTYEVWLKSCRDRVLKAGTTWERVRLVDASGNPLKQFDMAASFSKAIDEIESVIVLFDRTDTYNADDQEISFVAMAVHELRTPLTVMRGYIEVFEDELGPTLSDELKDFMHKMHASAQQLTAFVSNILNVARVEENQLVLTLVQQNIGDIITGAVKDLQLRANVHGKTIELVLPQSLPTVAADRISLHEVINNLVDNAIKYSGKSDKIVITVHAIEGFVQIDVQDFGVGIPDAVVPHLFDKFYRSHRSKVQIGGTGLGLYLCKAIVAAHGGNIWLKTKEGEGTIFSFTVEQYDEAKHTDGAAKDGITRGAHGWIKNHSMYRR